LDHLRRLPSADRTDFGHIIDMFTSALKSFSSNISANYNLSVDSTSSSGPWKIYDATKKSTGKTVSVFIFDRKSLEPHPRGLSGRPGPSVKRAQDEVVERLRKEASSLARLRHPNILELVEPVEETRYGSLMFATEPVSSSLSGLLQEKDDQERAGGVGGRPSRYVVEDGDGRRRREVEIDELEVQKGLLQIGKGLEFLHESAGLVHGNLTPESIYINAKVPMSTHVTPRSMHCLTPVWLCALGGRTPWSLLNLRVLVRYLHRVPRLTTCHISFHSSTLELSYWNLPSNIIACALRKWLSVYRSALMSVSDSPIGRSLAWASLVHQITIKLRHLRLSHSRKFSNMIHGYRALSNLIWTIRPLTLY